MSATTKLRKGPKASEEIARLAAALDEIELGPPSARRTLLTRYLEYAHWLDRSARRAQRRHYGLRLTAMVGGILLPAIAGIDAASDKVTLHWITVGLGTVVAVSIACDGFFNLRERWLHFRRASEQMQAELWRFAALGGPRYQGMTSHDEAFQALVATCEEAMAAEVETYAQGPAREAVTAAGAASPTQVAGP